AVNVGVAHFGGAAQVEVVAHHVLEHHVDSPLELLPWGARAEHVGQISDGVSARLAGVNVDDAPNAVGEEITKWGGYTRNKDAQHAHHTRPAGEAAFFLCGHGENVKRET